MGALGKHLPGADKPLKEHCDSCLLDFNIAVHPWLQGAHPLFLFEPGVYSLILCFPLERWVFGGRQLASGLVARHKPRATVRWGSRVFTWEEQESLGVRGWTGGGQPVPLVAPTTRHTFRTHALVHTPPTRPPSSPA